MTRDHVDSGVTAMLADAATAVVSDVLDRMGWREQVLDPAIRPLWPEARFVGVAVPVVIVADSSEPELPYDGELTALDGLQPGDVPGSSSSRPVSRPPRGASSSRAQRSAAVQPVWSSTDSSVMRPRSRHSDSGVRPRLSPLDTFGRAVVTGVDVEARVGGVDVVPGDLIVGDVDGIVAIPRALAADVAEGVATKHRLEGNARDDLLAGLGIREVWEKYGVL